VPECPNTLAPVPYCPKTLLHWCRNVSGLNCLGSDVSVSLPGTSYFRKQQQKLLGRSVTRHFEPGIDRHRDTLALRCPDILALVPKCPKDTSDLSAEQSTPWSELSHGPKCLALSSWYQVYVACTSLYKQRMSSG